MNNKKNEYKIIKYIDGEIELDVRFSIDDNTVWLSQNDMANLFDTTKQNISKHINKLISENELFSTSTVNYWFTVQTDDSRMINRRVKFYSLDIILAVGYRTKSNRINKFNNWVKETLNELNNESQIPKTFNKANNYEVVKYESGSISIDINISPNEDTVWLTQNDMANLFDTTILNISIHISNIFNDLELEKNSVIKKFLTTASDGKTYNVEYYNLDMVLSVGYRVNSKRGIEFRRNEYCRLS